MATKIGELSADLKKALEASEDGKKLLSAIEAVNKEVETSDTLQEELKTVKAQNALLQEKMDNIFNPEFVSRMASAAEGSRSKGREEEDFDSMTVKDAVKYIEGKVGEALEGLKNDVGAGFRDYTTKLNAYMAQTSIDNLKRLHKLSGRKEDFDKDILPKMQEAGKNNPNHFVHQVYDDTIERIESSLLKQKADEEAAKEAQEAEKARLRQESPGVSAAVLGDKKYEESIEGIRQMASDMGVTIPAE